LNSKLPKAVFLFFILYRLELEIELYT